MHEKEVVEVDGEKGKTKGKIFLSSLPLPKRKGVKTIAISKQATKKGAFTFKKHAFWSCLIHIEHSTLMLDWWLLRGGPSQ